MQAPKGKPIATYGRRCVHHDMGLLKLIHWAFVVADVSTLFIGADPPQQHNLLVDK